MEPGFFTRVVLPTCSLIHVNFTAKETDVDVARELFFAELTSTGEVLSCNFCVRLHPRDSALGLFFTCKSCHVICHLLLLGACFFGLRIALLVCPLSLVFFNVELVM